MESLYGCMVGMGCCGLLGLLIIVVSNLGREWGMKKLSAASEKSNRQESPVYTETSSAPVDGYTPRTGQEGWMEVWRDDPSSRQMEDHRRQAYQQRQAETVRRANRHVDGKPWLPSTPPDGGGYADPMDPKDVDQWPWGPRRK